MVATYGTALASVRPPIAVRSKTAHVPEGRSAVMVTVSRVRRGTATRLVVSTVTPLGTTVIASRRSLFHWALASYVVGLRSHVPMGRWFQRLSVIASVTRVRPVLAQRRVWLVLASST
jgi:hypothetical protein